MNRRQGSKVLLVDDSSLVRASQQSVLEQAGYKVSAVAVDGLQALELTQSDRFDFICLDIIMPNMNGLEFLERFRQTDSKTPVVLCTCLASEKDAISILESKMDPKSGIIPKPLNIEDLENTLDRIESGPKPEESDSGISLGKAV